MKSPLHASCSFSLFQTWLFVSLFLKFRYKRRVYTQSYVDDKQLAKLHTKVGNTILLMQDLNAAELLQY